MRRSAVLRPAFLNPPMHLAAEAQRCRLGQWWCAALATNDFPSTPPSLLLFQKGDCMDHLTQSRLGRVVLHALCLLRRPGHARWHWLGIIREFAPLLRLS